MARNESIHGVVPLDLEGEIRLARFRGKFVTLVSNQLKAFEIPLDYIGESEPGLAFTPDQTCAIHDFAYNARYSDLLAIGSLSKCLERRICFETIQQAEKFCAVDSLKRIDGTSSVMLDFGLRATPFFQAEADPSEGFLDETLMPYFKDHVRLQVDSEDQGGDLDMEVDAINLAYLWSGFSTKESPEVLRARKQLRFRLMGSQSSPTDLHHGILEMEDPLLKNVFMAICITEGFLNSSLEEAEQGLNSTLLTLQARDADSSRMGILVEFLLANLQIQKQQAFAREQMLRLANTGNLFAQVFVSRHFANSFELGVLHGLVFEKFTKTGYGVSESLPPLYSSRLKALEDKPFHNFLKPDSSRSRLKKLAKRSAACGNPVGKVAWMSMINLEKKRLDIWIPSECALAGTLCYLSSDLLQARDWFNRAGLDVALAFVNMESETDPTGIVSWLTCMDCCWPEDQDLNQSLWFQLISDKVLEAKLKYSLLMFGLDEDSVLATLDYSRLETLKKLYSTSRSMETEELGDKFLRKIRDKYLDARGLRMLGGIHRSNNNLEAAIECYTIGGDTMNCAEAMLDAAVGHLEIGKVGKALTWAERAGFPYQLLVLGIAPGVVGMGEAIEGFKVAAEAGDPRAMWFLGELLSSEMWLASAAESGFHEALLSMQDLSKYSGDVNDFWRFKEEEVFVRSLCGFTGRVGASDVAIVCAFRRRWVSS